MTTEYSGSGDLSRSLALLWDMGERSPRGPKPTLTVARVVTAAVAVADAEGLTALSMRRVAAELGVGTMSLYRYVPGKAELLDLMLDKVIEPREEFDPPESLGWRRVVEIMARGAWELYLAHPWLVQVDQVRSLLGPNALIGVEFIMRGLGRSGLTDQQKVSVMVIVDGFVTGIARTHINSMQAEQRTGVSNDDFWAAQYPVLEKAMGSGRYPTLAQLSPDAFDVGFEAVFDFGLERLLDGLEAYVANLPADSGEGGVASCAADAADGAGVAADPADGAEAQAE